MFSNMTSTRELAPQIDAVVLLDRTVDLMTPLSTQLTYEGLIDEIYGITHSEARGMGEEGGTPAKGYDRVGVANA